MNFTFPNPPQLNGVADSNVTNKKSGAYQSFSEKYGNFCQRVLYQQIHKLAAEKISSLPIGISVREPDKNETLIGRTKEKLTGDSTHKLYKTINNLLNDFKERTNLNTINYQIGYKNSSLGNSTLIADYIGDGVVNLYVPQYNITRIDPATTELLYLQIVRFYTAGTLLNVVSETRTRWEITWDYFQMEDTGVPSKNEFDSNPKKYTNKKNKADFKTIKESMGKDFSDFNSEPQSIKNPYGFIFAQYIENVPSPLLDFKGQPDIDETKENLYTALLDEIYIRYHWELTINKSKLFVNNEQATSFMEKNQGAYDEWLKEGYLIRNNNVMRPMGDTGANVQYFETNNQNLQNLTQLWDYFIKKWWEKSAHHQSSSDSQGRNVTEFETKLERYAEESRYAQKIVQLTFAYKHLTWKMIKVFEHHGDIPSIKGKFKFSDILIDIKPFTIINEKERIANEVVKIQSNLSNRQEGIKALSTSPLSNEEALNLSEKYLNNNIEDIKKELQAKPVQEPQEPSTNNPGGKAKAENKQTSGFYSQLDKKKDKEK